MFEAGLDVDLMFLGIRVPFFGAGVTQGLLRIIAERRRCPTQWSRSRDKLSGDTVYDGPLLVTEHHLRQYPLQVHSIVFTWGERRDTHTWRRTTPSQDGSGCSIYRKRGRNLLPTPTGEQEHLQGCRPSREPIHISLLNLKYPQDLIVHLC